MPARRTLPGRGAPPWGEFLRRRSPEAALRVLAAWLGAGVSEVALTGPDGEIATAGEPGPGAVRAFPVPGEGGWTLAVRSAPPLSDARVRRAAEAMAAWRVAREEAERALAGAEARSGEVEVLQTLARRAAEARGGSELFAAAAALLAERAGLAGLVVVTGDRSTAWLAAPCDPAVLAQAAARGAEAGGFPPPGAEPAALRLDAYDEQAAAGPDILEPRVVRGRHGTEGVLVPLAARGQAPPARLLQGAAQALGLHLTRIAGAERDERDRFRAVLEALPIAVMVVGEDLVLRLANAAARDLLARLDAGDGRLERLGPIDVASLGETGREARLPDGTVLVATAARVGEDRVVVVSDLTEDRRVQEGLAQAEKLTSLGQMISGVAHELNNPLASVLGYAQLVAAQSPDPRLAQKLEIIREEAGRCRRIVQNLLQFARRHEPERRPLSLNEVARSVHALMEYPLRADGIRCEVALDRDLPVVPGDRHQLQQVLVNLVANAHQALRGAGRGGSVTIATRSAGGGVQLEVRDDGPGIPEAIRSRIFDPFFTTKPAGQGTGLGLALVYGIVSAHGGAIRAEAAEGGGAAFVVDLPAGRSAEAAAEPPDEPDAAAPPRAGRVLVVDDEERLVRLVCEALAADGHRTVGATDGREALGHLEREEFDVVLSDVRMPGMGAERLCREMDRLRPGLSRRLVLTTGDTLGEETATFTRRREVLHKPFDLEDLRRVVRRRLAARPDAVEH